jgi:precorrin-6B methylase 2
MQQFEAEDIARLERAYSTPQIVDQRRRFRAAVAARPGEVGLDVGCGAGHLACELALEIAPGGRIVAIESRIEIIGAQTNPADSPYYVANLLRIRGDSYPEESTVAQNVFRRR